MRGIRRGQDLEQLYALRFGYDDELLQAVSRRCCLPDGQPALPLDAAAYRRYVVAAGPTPTAGAVGGWPLGDAPVVASGGRRRHGMRRIGHVFSTMRRRALTRPPPHNGGGSVSFELPQEAERDMRRSAIGDGSQEHEQRAELRRKIRDTRYLERAIRFLAQVFVDDAPGARRK